MNHSTVSGPPDPNRRITAERKALLYQLAEKYGVDKLFSHSYLDTYSKLFCNRKVARLLEIGIGYEDLMWAFVPFYVHGASLKMWSEYWPDADIYACDIREDTLINEGRIKSVVCDQSSIESIYAMTGAFDSGHWDVIIDDGSHQMQDQYRTAATLLVEPYLNKGGVYIIEDTYPDKGAELAEMLGGVLVVGNKRPDDCLVVIHR